MTPEDMEAQIAAIAADNVAIEDYRAKFGDEKAAQFAADLYKLRRTPAPPSAGMFSGLPRSIIILIAIWVGLLETADKLPRLLLSYPGYEATLAEYHAKMMQPDITAAQLEKARNEAKASTYQPGTAEAQLEKSKQEARASAWQPLATAAQGLETEGRFMSNGNLSGDYTEKMSHALGRLKPLYESWQPSLDLPSPDLPKKTEALTPPEPATPPAPPKTEAKARPPPTEKPAPSEPSPPPAAPKIEAQATPPPTGKPAPSEPTPAPLRTPTAFDCAKASMGVDYVICASPALMDAEARLEDALHAAHAAKGDQVKLEQWVWIKHYGADCGLPLKGRPADEKIHGAAGCVREAMEQRIKELQAEQ